MPIAEYSIAFRKRVSLSEMCLRSARKAYITIVMMLAGSRISKNGSHGIWLIRYIRGVASREGSAAIISDTIITVVRKIKKASIRGRRTALHINSTIMKVKGHGRYSIESQLNVSVMANVSSDSKSNLGLRWRSR